MGSCAVPRGAPLIIHDRPSPNRGPRRGDVRPDMVVIHFTAMGSAGAALARLCDPAAEVSAHYLVAPAGAVTRMVPEELRAWHAGAGAWGATTDVNSRSIGIELCNDGGSPFPEPQMTALERLLAAIMRRWRIPPERVIGHSDCAPGRKVDPGPKFDWARLSRGGLAVSVPPLRRDGDGFVADMRTAGYSATEDPAILLAALRLRHRPWARGARDAWDAGLARALARRFPVDRPAPGR